MRFATPEEIKETSQRPDSLWLSLEAGKNQKTLIVNWSQINDINGDFGTADAVIVVEVPLYGSSEDVLHIATMYVFNQIDIFEKTKENKKLFMEIGNG